jgi:hypothetical protein
VVICVTPIGGKGVEVQIVIQEIAEISCVFFSKSTNIEMVPQNRPQPNPPHTPRFNLHRNFYIQPNFRRSRI